MSSSKRRSSSSLPFELEEEILCRVPVESLERFRTICKQWCTLFDDKRFIYKSLDLAKEKRFIQVNHRSIQLFSETLLCLPIPEELHHPYSQTIHCDGLLLVILHACSDQNRKLAVWNPFLSRVKLIETSSPKTTHEIYGFGYDNVSRDNYKILRIKTQEHTYNYTQGRSSGIEIYEFKSKLWRSVDATLDECVLFWWKHVSINGNMYWIAQAKMANSEMETFIQSFDFSTETFKPICCLPDGVCCYSEEYYGGRHHHMILSGSEGDRLSLLHRDKNLKIGVWITNKVTEGIVSWSRLFNVDSPDLSIFQSNSCSYPAYYIHKTNKIILWREESDGKQNYGNIYEMGEGEINKLVVMRSQNRPFNWFYSCCHVYVPSLVPVPE